MEIYAKIGQMKLGFKKTYKTVEKLRLLSNKNQTLGQLALRYVLSHPAVSVVIPGAKTGTQAQENANASVRPILSDEELNYIHSI